MTLNFLVAPDFAPDRFAGWHMLNTLLQARSGLALHLLMPASAAEQAEHLRAGRVDLIYANPFDASHLIRELGYVALARPRARSDEMVIATAAASPAQSVEGLKKGARIALTDNRDVKLIGLRLLEPADLAEADLEWVVTESYQAAARLVIKREVDAAFFLADAFHALSRMTLAQLRVLVESALDDISHVVLAHPRIAGDLPRIGAALVGVGEVARDAEVLDALGLPQGFVAMTAEEAEFMIDLMDTLQD